ncbi:MAG: hypothetical protein AVDCRST_MAG03-2482, partial [uncultured Rubrobacteraceae bacterium]
ERSRLPRADHHRHRRQLRHRGRVRPRVREAGFGRRARSPTSGPAGEAGRRVGGRPRYPGHGDTLRSEPPRRGPDARRGGRPARARGHQPRQQRGLRHLRAVPRGGSRSSSARDRRERRERRGHQPGVRRAAARGWYRGADQRREHGGVPAHPEHGRLRGEQSVCPELHRGLVAGVFGHGAAGAPAISRSHPHRVQRRHRGRYHGARPHLPGAGGCRGDGVAGARPPHAAAQRRLRPSEPRDGGPESSSEPEAGGAGRGFNDEDRRV